LQDQRIMPRDGHYVTRTGWLRASVLGANDGIVSISALIVGVAAAEPSPTAVFLAGFAGLSAGAMSMAAGEYVSVSSQSDVERADIEREKEALSDNPEREVEELEAIYRARGLNDDTARIVAEELSEHDALGAHVRDELGISAALTAKPLQAALASGATFSVAGAVPMLAAILAPVGAIIPVVLVVTLLALAALGALGAWVGGAPLRPAVLRVVLWGVMAMGITAAVGKLAGVAV